jgi:flagellin-like hook-associated protein FlgL
MGLNMIINHNMPGSIVGRYANATDRRLKGSIEKLSSGLKINRAGDNSAGLAVSEKMRAQIAGLMQASANSEDGIGMIDTFEGALTETHAILRRIKTLAVQSANGNYSNETDRAAIELEYEELLKELDDIAETDFNGVQVLNKPSVSETLPSAPGYIVSGLFARDFSSALKDSLVDSGIMFDGDDLAVLYTPPVGDIMLSNPGDISFGYHMDENSNVISFDVMQNGSRIGGGTVDLENYSLGTSKTIELKTPEGMDLGSVNFNLEDHILYDYYFFEDMPELDTAALLDFESILENDVDPLGDAQFSVTYEPPEDFTRSVIDLPIGTVISENPIGRVRAFVSLSGTGFGLSVRTDMGEEILGHCGFNEIQNNGDSVEFVTGFGNIRVTHDSGTVGALTEGNQGFGSPLLFRPGTVHLRKESISDPVPYTEISGLTGAVTEAPTLPAGAYKQLISLPVLTKTLVLTDNDFTEFTDINIRTDELMLDIEPEYNHPLTDIEFGYHVSDKKFYVDVYTDDILKGSKELPLDGLEGRGMSSEKSIFIDGEDYGLGFFSYDFFDTLEITDDVPYRKFPNTNRKLDATFLPSSDGYSDTAKYELNIITFYDPIEYIGSNRVDASGNQYTKTGIGVRDYNTTVGAGESNPGFQGLTLTDEFKETLSGGKMYGKYEVNTWIPSDTDTPTGGPGINFYSDSDGNAVIASTGDIGGLSVGETIDIYTVPDRENAGSYTLGGYLNISDCVEVDVNTTSVGVYSDSSMHPVNLVEYGIADGNGLAKLLDATAFSYGGGLGITTGYVVFEPTEAYLTELAEAEEDEPVTRTDSQSLSLQVGSRTKDLKNYNFDYGTVWTEERVRREAIGDLSPDLCVTAEGLGLVVEKVNLSTQFNANEAIDAVDCSIAKVSLIRASFGAIHNRLGHKIENLNTTTLNVQASESALRDTNVADGVADMMKEQALMSTVNKMAVIAGNQLDSVMKFFE